MMDLGHWHTVALFLIALTTGTVLGAAGVAYWTVTHPDPASPSLGEVGGDAGTSEGGV
jgi:NhaP-type Na+/H+ or K+/H+ antiporter